MNASQRGRSNRRRGADAEREVVAWLQANGYPDARRYLAGDGRQPGDIDGTPWCIEVKAVQSRSAWPTWCAQALSERRDVEPVIVVRRTRGVPDVALWECRWTTSTDPDPAWVAGEPFGHVVRLLTRRGAA